ncbi:MAG: TIGR02587 family membrane protein [Dehalococcoidia bacterium]|nr:TIGR02587 family membrane protein [Dehalococcoidia bacterium]
MPFQVRGVTDASQRVNSTMAYSQVVGRARQDQITWSDQLNDLERALAGGFLFGIPLIYTLEAWEIGASIESATLLAFFAVVFGLNAALAHISGFKEQTTFHTTIVDAVEAMAIGIVAAGIVLVILGRITADTPVETATGRLLIVSIPFSLGVSLANILLRPRGESRLGDDGEKGGGQSERQALLVDVGATVIGAAFVAYAIAPTDEVQLLARELGPVNMIGVLALSLITSFVIVFQSEFSNAEGRRSQPGPFQHPITETVLAYVVSLLVGAFLLVLFDRVDLDADWRSLLDEILLLGLPASIGGAAGRLAA